MSVCGIELVLAAKWWMPAYTERNRADTSLQDKYQQKKDENRD